MSDQKEAKSIKKPDSIDLKIVQLLLEKPSITDIELSIAVGVSRMTANRRRNSSKVAEILEGVLTIPEKEVRRLVAKSLRRLEELLDHPDPRFRALASTQLLKLGLQLHSTKFARGSALGEDLVIKIGYADEDEDQHTEVVPQNSASSVRR